MPAHPETHRLPNFIIIGRVCDGELDCLAAMNGDTIADDHLWNTLLTETYRCLSIATGETLAAWNVENIRAVILPDADAIGFAARIDLAAQS